MRRPLALGPVAVCGVLATGLLLAPVASAASHVYASGTLGANGVWCDNPCLQTTPTRVSQFNRMSSTTPSNRPVWVRTAWDSADSGTNKAVGFVQQARTETTYGWINPVHNICYNQAQPAVNITNGYCAWYD